MESQFLTKEDMIRLTDYKLPSKQIKVLENNGIPYTVDRWGHPVVLRSSLSPNKEAVSDAFNWSTP